VIQARELSKTFGDFKAVDNISFEVAAGEIFAFLGPNGAGKTTTIKMLTTLLRPTSGSVSLAIRRKRDADSASCFRIRVSMPI
jgi:ABC-2 type transport system ATP-binding protein